MAAIGDSIVKALFIALFLLLGTPTITYLFLKGIKQIGVGIRVGIPLIVLVITFLILRNTGIAGNYILFAYDLSLVIGIIIVYARRL